MAFHPMVRDETESMIDILQKYEEDEENQGMEWSATDEALAQTEVGYFCTLNSNFKSTEEDIRK